MHRVRPPDGRGAGRPGGALRGLALVAIAALFCGCVVTTAEYRKLESRVIDMERAQGDTSARGRYADVASDVDAIEGELRTLSGRIEELERTAANALAEARRARQDLATLQMETGAGADTVGAGAVVTDGEGDTSADAPASRRARRIPLRIRCETLRRLRRVH